MLSGRARGPHHRANRPATNASGAIPDVVPALPRDNARARNLPWRTALQWLRLGWSDLWTNPVPSLLYGVGVYAISTLLVWALFLFNYEYTLFPVLAGFMVIGPIIASGLYERRLYI